MAKKFSTAPLTASDIANFLDNESDFGFELSILKLLGGLGIMCQHGGTYDDPVTQKKRQFDLRAVIEKGPGVRIRLAIECKNLDSSYPLVVQCMARRAEESFHELIYSKAEKHRQGHDGIFNQTESIPLSLTHSFYARNESVGKACQQVGKTDKGELAGSNSEIYDKWSQAISSSHGLLDMVLDDGLACSMGCMVSIIPALVVPDGTLWVVSYDETGRRDSDPTQADRIPYFLDAEIKPSNKMQSDSITLSHLELVTVTGLQNLINQLKNDDPSDTLFCIPHQNPRSVDND